MLCDDLEGWDGEGGRKAQEGGDTGIQITDSLCFTVEPTQHSKAIIV